MKTRKKKAVQSTKGSNSSTRASSASSSKRQNQAKSQENDEIPNLLAMTIDELISYVDSQLGQDWEMEMGFVPGFVREVLSGEGAAEFKSLLLSQLDQPKQQQQPQDVEEDDVEEEEEVEEHLAIKQERFYECELCNLKFSSEIDCHHHSLECRQNNCDESSSEKISKKRKTVDIISIESEIDHHGDDSDNNSNDSGSLPTRRRKTRMALGKIPVRSYADLADLSDKESSNGGGESELEPEDMSEEGESDHEMVEDTRNRKNLKSKSGAGAQTQRRKKKKSKSKPKQYHCQVESCSLVFDKRNDWMDHEIAAHGVRPMIPRSLLCTRCEINFSTVAELEAHEETHASDKPFKCSYCYRRFPRKDHRKTHEELHTMPGTALTCTYPMCEFRCTRRDKLKRHFMQAHTIRASNAVTGFEDRVGSDRGSEDGFIMIEPGEEPPVVQKQPRGEPVVKCPVEGCTKSYTIRSSLRGHLNTSHPDYLPFPCSTCGKKFSLEHYLKLHETRVHSLMGRFQKEWRCEIGGCDKSYTSRKSLEVHIREHLGDYRYPCTKEGCDKKFTGIKSFRQHMRIHAEIKPFSCPYEGCDFRASHWTSVKFHMGSKHDKRPRKCQFCSFTAVFDFQIRYHINHKHTGQRPYPCTRPGCDKTFTNPSCLRKHTNYHNKRDKSRGKKDNISGGTEAQNQFFTGSDQDYSDSDSDFEGEESQAQLALPPSTTAKSSPSKSYSCDLCSETFSQGSALRHHMKSAHAPPPTVSTPVITLKTRKPRKKPAATTTNKFPSVSMSSSSSTFDCENERDIDIDTDMNGPTHISFVSSVSLKKGGLKNEQDHLFNRNISNKITNRARVGNEEDLEAKQRERRDLDRMRLQAIEFAVRQVLAEDVKQEEDVKPEFL